MSGKCGKWDWDVNVGYEGVEWGMRVGCERVERERMG